MKENSFFIQLFIIICGLSFLLGWSIRGHREQVGAYSVSGLPGVYNASGVTVPDGSGVALALDSSGQVVVSSSTTLNVITP